MTTKSTYTIRESDDTAPLDDIYLLHDLGSLTEDQEQDFVTATYAAMRPLVEAEWAKHGCAVRWLRNPRTGPLVADQDEDFDQAPWEEKQIAVWASAYDALDVDAIWSRIIAAPAALEDAGANLATRREQVTEALAGLREQVRNAAQAGVAEAAIARIAGIDRMTVRSWLGK